MRLALVLCALFFSTFILQPGDSLAKGLSEHFPVGPEVRRRADFWIKVYTEINSDQAFIHDSDDLTFTYKTVSLAGLEGKRKRNFLKNEKGAIQKRLLDLSKKLKNQESLSDEDQKFLQSVGNPDHRRLYEMSRNIRYQQGMRDRYYVGLVRSQKYIEQIKQIFTEMGVPLDLAYLPHVESSFNYLAYSKVGAAGMWQFMRSSARVYRIKMNYVVDERRDPMISTRAAGRHLLDNYARLKTWPLAVTAYNHGPASIARAVEKVGSTSMDDIIQKYEARRFGFASKNFYATFVATVEISLDPGKYFDTVPKPDPFTYAELALNKRVSMDQIQKVTGLPKDVLQDYNPGLRPTAFRSNLLLPSDFKVKLPINLKAQLEDFGQKIAALDTPKVPEGGGGVHIVGPGESLYLISKVYNVPMRDLVMLNNIDSPNRIQPRMKLRIPGKEDVVAAQSGPKSRATSKPSQKKPVVVAAIDNSKVEAIPGRIEQKELLPQTPTPTGEHANVPLEVKNNPEPNVIESPPIELAAKEQSSSGFFSKIKSFFASSPKAEPGVSEDLAQASKQKADDHQSMPSVDFSTYNLEAVALDNGYFRVAVEVEETLGHLAEWAGTRAQNIRNWNGLRFGSPIHIGQKLRLKMTEEQLAVFNRDRAQYHQAIEEDFFESYKLDGTKDYVVRRGDSVNSLVNDLEMPMWLIRKFQTDNPGLQLVAGQKITIPIVVARNEAENTVTDESGAVDPKFNTQR